MPPQKKKKSATYLLAINFLLAAIIIIAITIYFGLRIAWLPKIIFTLDAILMASNLILFVYFFIKHYKDLYPMGGLFLLITFLIQIVNFNLHAEHRLYEIIGYAALCLLSLYYFWKE